MSFAQQKNRTSDGEKLIHKNREYLKMMITGVSAVEDTVQLQNISCRNERELGATASLDFMLSSLLS